MVEQRTHKPLVVGSSPTLATKPPTYVLGRKIGFLPIMPAYCRLFFLIFSKKTLQSQY